jgi:hypothetical protein
MAIFIWNCTGLGGDWSMAANWTAVRFGTPPPGSDDIALFGELPITYAVNVITTVDVDAIIIRHHGANSPSSGIKHLA